MTTAVACLLLGGCDSVLDVKDPDLFSDDDLASPSGAEALYLGALGEFTMAKDGSTQNGASHGLVWIDGVFSDELRIGGLTPWVDLDLRAVGPSSATVGVTYLNLHRVRAASEHAAAALLEFSGDSESAAGDSVRAAEMFALSAYTHLYLGEVFCSGVPLGDIDTETGDAEFGEPLPTDSIFERALTRLAEADPLAAGDLRLQNLIAVARGRAFLNLGRYAEAASAVSGVPTGFEEATLHSTTPGQENRLFADNWGSNLISVSPGEGTNGMAFGTAGDPRVPVVTFDADADGEPDPSLWDGVTPMYFNLAWNSASAAVAFASGIEARMIEAEAALQSGDVTGWLDILNATRAFDPSLGLAPLTDPGTAASRVDLLFRERAFWLFGTGHRVGDLRRLIRQYERDPETVFPTGAYHKDGLDRGTDVNVPIPESEFNNPNFEGCLDRDA